MKIAAFFAAFALIACSASSDASDGSFPEDAYVTFSAADDSVEVRTAPAQPPERGDVAMELRVVDGRDDLDITVVPFMPAHGHGASVVPAVTPLGAGRYRVTRLELAMPGTWQLRFAIKGPGIDTNATATLEVR